MAGRKFSRGAYRYGFNGVESVSELKEGHNTTFFREQDTRIGRWWSIDPKTRVFESPYVMMGNNPMLYMDVLGDTTYLYSGRKENGDLMYSQKQLKKIAEHAAKVDKLNGIKGSVYIPTTLENLESGKHTLNEFEDYAYVFEDYGYHEDAVPGKTWNTLGSFNGKNIVVGTMRPNQIQSHNYPRSEKVLFINSGKALSHERNVHGVRHNVNRIILGTMDIDVDDLNGLHHSKSGLDAAQHSISPRSFRKITPDITYSKETIERVNTYADYVNSKTEVEEYYQWFLLFPHSDWEESSYHPWIKATINWWLSW